MRPRATSSFQFFVRSAARPVRRRPPWRRGSEARRWSAARWPASRHGRRSGPSGSRPAVEKMNTPSAEREDADQVAAQGWALADSWPHHGAAGGQSASHGAAFQVCLRRMALFRGGGQRRQAPHHALLLHRRVMRLAGENLAHHGHEEVEVLRRIGRVEGGLVPALAEIDAGLVDRAKSRYFSRSCWFQP